MYELLLGWTDCREAGRREDDQKAEPGEEEREAPPAPGDPPNPEAPPGLEGPQIHMEPPVPEGLQGPEDIKGERQGREEEVQDQGPGAQAGRSGAVAHAQLGSLPKPQGMDSGLSWAVPPGPSSPLGRKAPPHAPSTDTEGKRTGDPSS